MITKIEFESDAKYITAWDNSGNVVIRCNFDYTDCGDEESLPEFIERHGGLNDCARYLRACYWYSTN